MKVSSAKRAKPGYKFYENGPDRQISFVAIPREMIDPKTVDNVKANWSRVVAFGDLAELINKLYDSGVTMFGLTQGRIRNNNLERPDGTIWEAQEIVAEALKMKDFAKQLKAVQGTGEYSGKALPDAS